MSYRIGGTSTSTDESTATIDEAGRRRYRLIPIVIAVLAMAAACGDSTSDSIEEGVGDVQEQAESVDPAEIDADAADEQVAELAETLRANGMESFASVVEQVDISELVGSEEFSVLGPNDDAFLALGADETADLLADPSQLSDILRNHILQDKVDGDTLRSSSSVTTEAGTTLNVTADGEAVTIGPANLVETDIAIGDGGVLHVIDQILMP